jgi:septum site-determining protein MinC
MQMNSKTQIKGLRDGLLITLGDGAWEEVESAFLEQLDQQGEFLRGARLALDVGNHVLKAADLGRLRNAILERDLTLWAVLSNSPTTEQTAQTLGLATRITKPQPERTVAQLDTALHGGESAILVRRTLRSGYSLQAQQNVIVIGDVNPGAEIVAGGDVIVWGRLRGVVHAGAQDNEGAVVCALELAPLQLRIAGRMAAAQPRRGKPQPETARLVNGQVVLEAWNPKK